MFTLADRRIVFNVDNGRLVASIEGGRKVYIPPELRMHVCGPAGGRRYAPHAELTALLALSEAKKAELKINDAVIFALVCARQAAVALLSQIMGECTFSVSEITDVGADDSAHADLTAAQAAILSSYKETIWAAQKDVGNSIILAGAALALHGHHLGSMNERLEKVLEGGDAEHGFWTRLTGADAGAAVDAEYKSFQHYSLHPFTMSMLMQAAVAQDKAPSFAPKIHSWLATRLPVAPAGTGVASTGVALLELAIKEGSPMRASLKALGDLVGFTRPETEGMLFKWTQIRRVAGDGYLGQERRGLCHNGTRISSRLSTRWPAWCMPIPPSRQRPSLSARPRREQRRRQSSRRSSPLWTNLLRHRRAAGTVAFLRPTTKVIVSIAVQGYIKLFQALQLRLHARCMTFSSAWQAAPLDWNAHFPNDKSTANLEKIKVLFPEMAFHFGFVKGLLKESKREKKETSIRSKALMNLEKNNGRDVAAGEKLGHAVERLVNGVVDPLMVESKQDEWEARPPHLWLKHVPCYKLLFGHMPSSMNIPTSKTQVSTSGEMPSVQGISPGVNGHHRHI